MIVLGALATFSVATDAYRQSLDRGFAVAAFVVCALAFAVFAASQFLPLLLL